MSSNTKCNYCTLQDFKQRGQVVISPAPKEGLGPDGVDVSIRYKGYREPVWAAWFMKLPDHCVCNE